MGISVFPAGGGEFITNDFVIDMNDTSNNVIDLGRSYAAGAYEISLASGDTSFDLYAVDADGNSVGYTNDATIVTTGPFTQVAILGVAQDEKITFSFSGASSDATSEGDATGAGAYLESINPSDLPNQDDTANIIGGNFATDVEIYFESGTVSTQAKNVVRSDSTALVVTRPDELDAALDPWDVRAVNPGVPEPTSTNANILAGTVDAGATPVWVTTSPLPVATINQAYSETLEATDADGDVSYSVTSGSLPTGLTLVESTGVLSGTPTASGSPFTVTATDEGGNTNEREFSLPVTLATGGTISASGNFIVHTFNSSGDFEALEEITDLEYIVLAGGGGGGGGNNANLAGGGGGGGGLLSSISGFQSGENTSALPSETVSAGTYTITIGAGGSGGVSSTPPTEGVDSVFATIGTAIGGGRGGFSSNRSGSIGGSGGGAANGGSGASGTTGQGFAGADDVPFFANNQPYGGGGSGGGSGSAAISGNNGSGGTGLPNFLDTTGWGAGGGGGGFRNFNVNAQDGFPGGSNYAGDGGNSSSRTGGGATANFGGGGGGSGVDQNGGSSASSGGAGGSGKVVIRYGG